MRKHLMYNVFLELFQNLGKVEASNEDAFDLHIQASFYGKESRSDNPSSNTTFSQLIEGLVDENSIIRLEDSLEIIPEIIQISQFDYQLTHKFEGWKLNLSFADDMIINEAISKIFKFASSQECKTSFESFSPALMETYWKVFTTKYLYSEKGKSCYDKILLALKNLSETEISSIRKNRGSHITSLLNQVKETARFFVANFENLTSKIDSKENSATNGILEFHPKRQLQLSFKKNKLDNCVETKLQNSLTQFMNEYRNEHKEILYDWHFIFSSQEASLKETKILIEALHIRYLVLLNLKNIMFLLCNSPMFLKNESALSICNINFNKWIPKYPSKNSNKFYITEQDNEEAFKYTETDFKTLLFEQLLSIFSLSAISISI